MTSKKVTKPWGYELWIQPGSETHPYVLKEICLETGFRTSLQVHQYKSETCYILSGTGLLWYADEKIDCNKILSGELTANDIKILSRPISTGDIIVNEPGMIHRMEAINTLIYMEASTTELDDVIRLQDDQGRQHGRIDSEH